MKWKRSPRYVVSNKAQGGRPSPPDSVGRTIIQALHSPLLVTLAATLGAAWVSINWQSADKRREFEVQQQRLLRDWRDRVFRELSAAFDSKMGPMSTYCTRVALSNQLEARIRVRRGLASSGTPELSADATQTSDERNRDEYIEQRRSMYEKLTQGRDLSTLGVEVGAIYSSEAVRKGAEAFVAEWTNLQRIAAPETSSTIRAELSSAQSTDDVNRVGSRWVASCHEQSELTRDVFQRVLRAMAAELGSHSNG
ncbi:MAG: hypothetical protein SFV15_00575 [Polyangiaceae bacterium]|nr:hypothetical protein [Polyangiaceae bacterium]